MKKIFLLFILLVPIASYPYDSLSTTKELFHECQHHNADLQNISCAAFINGYYTGLTSSAKYDSNYVFTDSFFRTGNTYSNVINLYVAWMKDTLATMNNVDKEKFLEEDSSTTLWLFTVQQKFISIKNHPLEKT